MPSNRLSVGSSSPAIGAASCAYDAGARDLMVLSHGCLDVNEML